MKNETQKAGEAGEAGVCFGFCHSGFFGHLPFLI
jgi:hypothetical protein